MVNKITGIGSSQITGQKTTSLSGSPVVQKKEEGGSLTDKVSKVSKEMGIPIASGLTGTPNTIFGAPAA